MCDQTPLFLVFYFGTFMRTDVGSVWSPGPRGSGGVAWGRVESGGPRLGWVVSKCLGNRLNSSLTSSLSETGLLLAVGTAPCTYLRTSVLQAQRLIMSQQGVGADLRHWEYQRQFCSGISSLKCRERYIQLCISSRGCIATAGDIFAPLSSA